MGTPAPRRPGPPTGYAADPDLPVWYAAYGSNMLRARFDAYLAGGRPPGGRRTYPGCRDTTPPAADLPLILSGSLYFAGESGVWGGGMAFLDPSADEELPSRGYLVTSGQFVDIAVQEMHRVPGPGAAPDLAEALRTGRVQAGPGRYETLLRPGDLDGHPVLTFTAPGGPAAARLNPPAAGYLRVLAAGLTEAHGWSPVRAAAYLGTRPGAAGHWNAAAVRALLEG